MQNDTASYEYSLAIFRWMKTKGKLVFAERHESGGHFAAYEKPNELVSDLMKMFGKGGPCFSVVEGASGYDS